jgi:hypothetical protein
MKRGRLTLRKGRQPSEAQSEKTGSKLVCASSEEERRAANRKPAAR